jgi:hypothetical protein
MHSSDGLPGVWVHCQCSSTFFPVGMGCRLTLKIQVLGTGRPTGAALVMVPVRTVDGQGRSDADDCPVEVCCHFVNLSLIGHEGRPEMRDSSSLCTVWKVFCILCLMFRVLIDSDKHVPRQPLSS